MDSKWVEIGIQAAVTLGGIAGLYIQMERRLTRIETAIQMHLDEHRERAASGLTRALWRAAGGEGPTS